MKRTIIAAALALASLSAAADLGTVTVGQMKPVLAVQSSDSTNTFLMGQSIGVVAALRTARGVSGIRVCVPDMNGQQAYDFVSRLVAKETEKEFLDMPVGHYIASMFYIAYPCSAK